jgi:hypothetical protein
MITTTILFVSGVMIILSVFNHSYSYSYSSFFPALSLYHNSRTHTRPYTQTRFAKIVPEAMTLLGFTGDQVDYVSSDLFISHAKQFVRMLDSIIDTLGPDLDMLTDILSELGRKCITYRVKREYISVMGIALFQTLKEFDDQLTEDIEISWREVYKAISVDMARVYDINSSKRSPKAKRKQTK